jgi:ankyrin repeat protein
VFDAIIDVVAKKCAWALHDALRLATRGVHYALVEKLLARGARPKEWRGSPMADAALLGDLKLMQLLDGPRADWNPPDVGVFDSGWPTDVVAPRDGDWPLLNAIRSGDAAVVAFVLERGADVNKTSRAGRNPVELAQALGHEDIVTQLQAAGGSAFDRTGLTFSRAVFYGFADEALALMPDIDDTHRGYAFQTAAMNADMRLVHALSAYATDKQLAIGIGSAAAKGDLPALHALLSLGAGVNAKDSLGLTPLIWAASKDHVPALRELLKAGAKIDAKGGDRQTALHAAVWEGRLGAVAFLLEAGADPNAVAGDGTTPHDLATKSVHRDALLPLLKAAGGRAEHRSDLLKSLKKSLGKAKRKAFRFETAEGPADATASRLGGQPFLNASHPRPANADGPLSLLLQVDLRAHPDKKAACDALLQVFEDPAAHPCVRARLVPSPNAEEHVADGGPEREGHALTFGKAATDFPSRPDDAGVALSDEQQALLPFVNLGGDKLGGWPDWVQEAEANAGELLLQLVGGGITQMDFGDAGVLYVLAHGDDVRVVAQSY